MTSSRRPPHPGPHFDPWRMMYLDPLWGVLMAYLQWRSIRGCPKSMRLPESADEYRTVSTRPRDVGRLEEFGFSWLELHEYQRVILLDCAVLNGEPWLKGRKWNRRLRGWRLSPRRYERAARDAWRNLKQIDSRRREPETAA